MNSTKKFKISERNIERWMGKLLEVKDNEYATSYSSFVL